MAQRRIGAESSATRALLIDITERMMIEDGYAAVSSRTVAGEAGITGAAVHYYFPTLDDLFLAVFRKGAEQQEHRLERLMASDQPLRALWAFGSEPAGTTLLVEFMALANHRKSIRSEIAAYAERFRQLELEVLTAHMREKGFEQDGISPEAIVVAIANISRGVVMEQLLGMTGGHADMLTTVEHLLDRVEGPAPARRSKNGAKKRSSTSKR